MAALGSVGACGVLHKKVVNSEAFRVMVICRTWQVRKLWDPKIDAIS